MKNREKEDTKTTERTGSGANRVEDLNDARQREESKGKPSKKWKNQEAKGKFALSASPVS